MIGVVEYVGGEAGESKGVTDFKGTFLAYTYVYTGDFVCHVLPGLIGGARVANIYVDNSLRQFFLNGCNSLNGIEAGSAPCVP